MRSKKLRLIFVLTLLLFGGEVLSFAVRAGNVALAKDDSKILQEKVKTLRSAAEKFADAYGQRNYKVMYELVNPQYRERVKLWEYKDFVDFPGVTDGYIEVEVADVSVLPKSDYKYGKVMIKIVMVETEKNKTTGKTTKIEDEKWEFQDWAEYKGKWYKLEKLDSN